MSFKIAIFHFVIGVLERIVVLVAVVYLLNRLSCAHARSWKIFTMQYNTHYIAKPAKKFMGNQGINKVEQKELTNVTCIQNA